MPSSNQTRLDLQKLIAQKRRGRKFWQNWKRCEKIKVSLKIRIKLKLSSAKILDEVLSLVTTEKKRGSACQKSGSAPDDRKESLRSFPRSTGENLKRSCDRSCFFTVVNSDCITCTITVCFHMFIFQYEINIFQNLKKIIFNFNKHVLYYKIYNMQFKLYYRMTRKR
jgi:hypothetical protein